MAHKLCEQMDTSQSGGAGARARVASQAPAAPPAPRTAGQPRDIALPLDRRHQWRARRVSMCSGRWQKLLLLLLLGRRSGIMNARGNGEVA